MRPVIPSREMNLEPDIQALLQQLPRSPVVLQQALLPYLQQLQEQHPNSHALKDYLEKQPLEGQRRLANAGPLVHNFALLLQPKHLLRQLQLIGAKLENTQRKVTAKREDEFERIEMLYPDYDNYYRMSKQEKSHLSQYHPKPRNKDFFTEPRFLTRIEEFAHFRNNDLHKGDMVLLHYHGHTIASGKAHLVGNGKALEVWLNEDNNYPLPTLTLPSEEELQRRKKEDDDKKDKEKQEELAPTLRLEFQHKLLGHTEKITCISLSQDELFAVTGSADRTIRLWCLRLKICLAVYRGHTRTLWDVHFSPSGYYIISGSADGLALLWKTDEPHAQRVYAHDAQVTKVSFGKDPSFVVTAGEDACIKIWSTLEATLLRRVRLGSAILTFSLGFSGAYLVAVEADGRITLLNLLEGKTVNSFYFYQPQRRSQQGQQKRSIMRIHDVCLSEDERELACVCSHFVLVYSMERLEKKVADNVFAFYQSNSEADAQAVLQPREVLYLGPQTNLTHCSYQARNVLLLAGHPSH